MELDDTEVFESDEEGNITGSFEDLDNESKSELRRKMSYIAKHSQDSNDIAQNTVLTCINEVAEIYPRNLIRKMKLVCESICCILRSNKPQMVFKTYQTIRNLSQSLKAPFSATYWKYLKLSFNNLLSPVQATVEHSLQMIYEMHSSFDPTYFIKTLRSALLHTQNANLKTNFAICLYQLLCHQKSNITQYCPTYFELFLVMNDKCKPMKQVCKETGKYFIKLLGTEEVDNILSTYYKGETINNIKEVLCFKEAIKELKKESAKPKEEEDDDDEEDNNENREPKMSSIKVGQHTFLIKKQSPVLIPAPRPYFPKENEFKKSKYYTQTTRAQILKMRSISPPPTRKSTSKSPKRNTPIRSSSAPTLRSSSTLENDSKIQSSIGKRRVSELHISKIERIKKSLLTKYKYNIRNNSSRSTSPEKQNLNNTKRSTRSMSSTKSKSTNKSSTMKSTSLNSSTYSRSEASRSRSRSPYKANTANTQATLNKIFRKARKEREERERQRCQVTGKTPSKMTYKNRNIKKNNINDSIFEENNEEKANYNQNNVSTGIEQLNEINHNRSNENTTASDNNNNVVHEEQEKVYEEVVVEEEEDDEFAGMTAEELFNELLKNISEEDRIKYQDQILTAQELFECFESDSDYNSYQSSSEDEEVEDENIKSKMNQSPIDEEEEFVENYDWNITDDEFYEGENP